MSRNFFASLVLVLLPVSVFGQEPQVETSGSVRVRVLMPNGKPAARAHVWAGVWTYEKGFKSNQEYWTDQEGWATVRLPKKLFILRLWARKPACVPLFLNWDINELKQLGRDNKVPEKFEFKLPAGTRISGVVKNEDGEPIEGVDIEVRHDTSEGPGDVGRIRLGTWLAEGSASNGPHPALRTDKNGRWELTNVPKDAFSNVRVKLRHQDYVNDASWGGLQKEQNVEMQQFRDGTAVIVMKRGIRLRGLVVDSETGKPIQDAVVIFGDDPYFQQDSQEVRTNEKGRYELPPQHPTEKVRVTVVAKGYAPAVKRPEISKLLERRKLRLDASFRMKRGKTIQIRFLDQDEKPVPKVYVGIRGWRGAKALYNHKHPNVLDTGIPHRANEQGVWEWTWAPDDEVSYSFGLTGYEVMAAEEGVRRGWEGVPLVAGDKPHVIRVLKKNR